MNKRQRQKTKSEGSEGNEDNDDNEGVVPTVLPPAAVVDPGWLLRLKEVGSTSTAFFRPTCRGRLAETPGMVPFQWMF